MFAGEESHYNITYAMLHFNIYTPGTTGECWGFISAMGREEANTEPAPGTIRVSTNLSCSDPSDEAGVVLQSCSHQLTLP